eukprot:4927559-Amphidinium_carterae.1
MVAFSGGGNLTGVNDGCQSSVLAAPYEPKHRLLPNTSNGFTAYWTRSKAPIITKCTGSLKSAS